MNYNPKPIKVLLITHEFGRRIGGGVGRIVNGMYNKISDNVILDAFLIKIPYIVDATFGYVYRRNDQNKAKNLYIGEYKETLLLALKEEQYNQVHIVVNSDFASECLKIIKTNFPDIKTIFSCHSIAKYDLTVRNNNSNELISEEYLINNADHIHVSNKAALQYLTDSYNSIVKKTRISIIPNGLDEEEYSTIDYKFRDEILKKVNKDDIVICCMARWSFGKGIDHLIDAIPYVIEKYKNVRFIVAGRKTQSWEHQVEKYVQLVDDKIKNVSDYVIPLGWLGNLERNTFFSIADICVMPSMREYFPYGILEPMVSKVPIIASNIECVSEMLEDEKECLLFTPGDSKEIAKKIINLIENKHKMEFIKENAYKKVKSDYTWQPIVDQYAQMYQSIESQTDKLKTEGHYI
jgi:glycosyltransferase involved in cell wall biosynthesis